MRFTRRHMLASGLLAPGLLGSLPGGSSAAAADYRALVVVHLNGGNDGHNSLVPTDGMHGDYQTARQNLALPRSSLLPLPGMTQGQTFGVHPAMNPLVPMYASGRLAFIANVGPLVEPATARQVLDHAVDLPPFLMSHSEQTPMVQGWTGLDDYSGWAGRSLELLPVSMRNRLSAVTMDSHRTLVLGKRSVVSMLSQGATRGWGTGDLVSLEEPGTKVLDRMARWQFGNAYKAEYARNLGSVLEEARFIRSAEDNALPPQGDFGSAAFSVGHQLRYLASLLPVFRAEGLMRQVFFVSWGNFDTHANQRGSDQFTQDSQLATLAQALRGFDDSNKASGMDNHVVTLVMTEFGRTVRPGSGGGSEHAWGNHWWSFGGPVAGGTVLGRFPSPVLGGADDSDFQRGGRLVPTTSSDQVGASLMQWMGLHPSQFDEAFPWLANFSTKTLPLLRA